MSIVTIDSGTTNTRVRIWQNNLVIAEACEAVGVRDTAVTGSVDTLTKAVKNALNKVLNQTGMSLNESVTIIASGMITSNVGLCEIPHLKTPVSLADLAKGMVKKVLPEITPYPIWFIPGTKNNIENVDVSNCEEMDIMRGEETETIGAMSYFNINKPTLVILPGSHSKFVKINEKQQIVSCTTTMAGELLDVMTQKTILSNSLNHQFASEIDEEYLIKGAESCKKVGLARSCFLVRILDLFSRSTENQLANYLLGAVLYSDIMTIKSSKALNMTPDTTIVICGKKILREALTLLIRQDNFFKGDVIAKDEEKDRPLSGLGAIAIARQMQQLNAN